LFISVWGEDTPRAAQPAKLAVQKHSEKRLWQHLETRFDLDGTDEMAQMRFGVRDFSPAFDGGIHPAAIERRKAANKLAAKKRD